MNLHLKASRDATQGNPRSPSRLAVRGRVGPRVRRFAVLPEPLSALQLGQHLALELGRAIARALALGGVKER